MRTNFASAAPGYLGELLPAAVAATLLASGVAVPAHAQTDPQTFAMEEILVTASRREERLIDAPVSLTSLNTDDLIRNGIVDINGLADFVPNLTAIDGGSPSLGGLTIRGIFLGGAPTTAIYVDDVAYGPVIGGAGTSLALDIVQQDLERIEVVRGPQGTLYGASAMGGLVRYVTRQPNLTEIEGFVTADVASMQHGGVSTTYRGKVSVPVIKDQLAVAVTAFTENADGYVDAPLAGLDDVNSHDFWGGSIAVLYEPTEKFSMKLHSLINRADFQIPGYVNFELATGERPLGDLGLDFTVGPRVNDFEVYSATFDYAFDFATLTSVTSYQDMFFDTSSDLTAAYGPTVDLLNGLPPGTARVDFNAAFDTNRFTQEIRLTSPSGKRTEWLAGAYYTDQETQELQNTTVTPPFDLLSVTGPVEYQELAAYGNFTYYIKPDWDVTVGARFSDTDTKVTRESGGILLGGSSALPVSEYANSTTTFLLNSRYRFSDEMALYGRVASGFRPGGANLVTTDPITGEEIGQPNYDSDNLVSYETGFKGELSDGRISYDIGVYYVDWQDAQVGTILSNGLGGTTNAQGDVSAMGIEVAFDARLFDSLMLSGSLAYAETELEDDEPSLGGLAGETLPGQPDVTAALTADYFFPAFGEFEGFVGLSWRYTGEYTMTYDGGIGANGQTFAPAFPNFTNDAYSRADARVGLMSDRYELTVYLTNITDESDFQTTFTNTATQGFGTVLQPRTVGAHLRVNF